MKNAYLRLLPDKVIKNSLFIKKLVKLLCGKTNKYKARITLLYLSKPAEVLQT